MNIRDILNMLQYLWGVVPLRLFVPCFAKKVLNYSVLLSVLQKFSKGLILPSLTTLGMSFLVLSGGRSLSVPQVHFRSLSPEIIEKNPIPKARSVFGTRACTVRVTAINYFFAVN